MRNTLFLSAISLGLLISVSLFHGDGLFHGSSAAAIAQNTSRQPEQAVSESANKQVLAELFTSQGCSSCPPADAFLAKLAREPGVIAISRPVTYWDRLGWKDSLARSANDRLQRRYAARGLPGSGVYTPELVINGSAATIGSRSVSARSLIAQAQVRARRARRAQSTGTSTGTSKASQTNLVSNLLQRGKMIYSNRKAADAQIKFMALASKKMVNIESGENRRRRLGYTNVVLAENAVDCSPSDVCRAAIPASIAATNGADRWVAVLQAANGGEVLAAIWIKPTTQ